ncbi:S8 family serine peptidase [Pseudoalteromonas sp. KAN5]|uniref:S8 family serine peptidase n=1 Tax=Pseudoalteromonas sp. KAN5 TaxID=2916633 RepID=UPI001FCC9B63|nr:S8 family serine peptidase [Pseudoalteromonas sp. KAN5]BDF93336.1 serine protease [Pseudoalteromonas sp. KAN5]
MIPNWPAIGEDYQGHGSHVASTAAGNILNNVPLLLTGLEEESDGEVLREDFFAQISGVAPHANIISYQVCHSDNDQGYSGCPGEALVAGIEDAISDGVDVINFSIGGADSNVWADPVQLAFLSAREAGISVAAAAGNSGTGTCGEECLGYLDNSSPWLTQVAATTHGRTIAIDTPVSFEGFIDSELGSEIPTWSETGLVGGAINNTEITGVVVWAKDYADENGDIDNNGYCTAPYAPNTFDFFKDGSAIPGAAEGDTNVIVVCRRHTPTDANANARTAKVDNVKAGGADAFILYNWVNGQDTTPEAYSIPGVHFTLEDFNGSYPEDGLEDWIDSTSEMGHMITIGKTLIERRVNEEDADWLAAFSSRGPSYSNVEILAPAVAAPGVDIYAAFSDEHPFAATPYGADFARLSGTSMASPHVAGALALMRQIHPTWTPAEIQSALLMTADNVVQYHRLNRENGTVGLAEIYRAGTGRINVESAAKAGLVMDESAENFLAANPFNGGTPHKLNLPNLVDFNCQPECQWVRTVKATRDGSWTIEQGDVVNWNPDVDAQTAQNGVNIEVIPANFSLKAGETQTIIVKASIMDTQDIFSNSEVELHSDLTFKSQDSDTPDARWPVVFKYDKGDLPASLKQVVHEDNGSFVVKQLPIPQAAAPVGQIYVPTKAQVKTVTIPKDDDRIFPWAINRTVEVAEEDILDEAVHQEFINVPKDAKRLIVEMQATIASPLDNTLDKGNPSIYVGKDYNENGIIEPQDEILCISSHSVINNFCNINNPEPGQYWALIYNSNTSDNQGVEETFTYTTAVVTSQVSTDITATLAASDGITPVDMEIAWQLPMQEEDIYYTAIDVGTSSVNQANVGTIPLKVIRGKNLINLDVPQTSAKINERIPYTFEVQANNTGIDREYTITAAIPSGLSITPENVLASNFDTTTINIEDNTLTITGTQIDTSTTEPEYIVTDNITDEMCRLPDLGNSNPGGYIDLKEFGILPVLSGFDDINNVIYDRGWIIPYAEFSNGAFSNFTLYNNQDEMNLDSSYMNILGTGLLGFNNSRGFAYHLEMPSGMTPYESVAPLWRSASINYDLSFQSLGLNVNEGISLASTPSGWGIIEWDNASDYSDPQYNSETGKYEWTKADNSVDFEVVFNANVDHGTNKHEIYFAYDNIDFADTDNRGSIGFQGFKGALYRRGPLEKFRGKSIAWDNLDEVVKDGYVVCMDYTGPEASYFEVTAWADVTPAAAGKTLNFSGTASLSGTEDIAFSSSLSVPSHITVLPLPDMHTTEETPVSFTVSHIDEQNSANQVLVSGEGVTAVVNGDTVTLTPDTNFSGVTEIAVTVADIEHPDDAASTSFLLTVENTDDAPTAVVAQSEIFITEGEEVTLDASQSNDVDGDELTFMWSGNGQIADTSAATTTVSGLTAGDHTFTVTVSDGKHTSEATMLVKVATIQESLSIADIEHTDVNEDESTEITVNFDNSLGQETLISAIADNASVQVSGHETGSTLTLTPTANFNGDIEVTVMVAFKSEPTAVAKTTFTLTVNAVNDAPVAEMADTHITVREDQVPTLAVTATDLDGDELSYQWAGSGTLLTPTAASTQVTGLAAGEYSYTVTISDGTTSVEQAMQVTVTKKPDVVEPQDNDDSSGSITWLALLMAGFAGVRRRNVKHD